MAQTTLQGSASRPLPYMLSRNGFMVSPSQSNSMLSPSMAPFFVLFGTQALVEHHLHRKMADAHGRRLPSETVSWASLVASGVAGATVGLVRPGGHAMMGTEVVAAILYFGSYRLLKSAIVGRRPSDADENNDGHNNNVVAIAVAGAMAGSLSELVRNLGTCTAPSRRFLLSAATVDSSPFASAAATSSAATWRCLLTRAAPAHALLFLGYEASLS